MSGNNVVFTFAGKPGYQQFDFYRYNVAVVPQHVFKQLQRHGHRDRQPRRHEQARRHRPVRLPVRRRRRVDDGRLEEARATGGRRRRSASRSAPTYVVDIKNGTNAAALSNLLAGNIDLFNNFAPKSAIKGKFKTYYNKAPYHLGANTTWLFPNTTKKPLNDQQFRRALAYSINMDQILDKAYQGLVNKASPTGLLPIWNKWIDKKVVKQYGFSYNVAKAKALLAAAGYKDTNGDGYVENKDGSTIDLTIVCPNGWSDWMTAIQVIADSAKAVGIKITPAYPGVRDAGRRPRPRATSTCCSATTGSTRTRRGRTTSTSSSCRSRTTRRRPTTSGTSNQTAWNLTQAAGQDADDQHQGVPGSDVEAADDVPAGSACDSALVQRHVVDGQHAVLDELAVSNGRAVHAHVLAELLADDEHRHAHASEAGQGHVGREHAPMIEQHPSRRSIREGCCHSRADDRDRESR